MIFFVRKSFQPFNVFHVPIKDSLEKIVFLIFQSVPCWVSSQRRGHSVFLDANGLGSLHGHVTSLGPQNPALKRGPMLGVECS